MDRTKDHASNAPEFNPDSIQYPEVAEQTWPRHATFHDQKAATAGVRQYDSAPFLGPDEQEKIPRPVPRPADGRRIAGLPAWAFWLILCAVGLIVVGASVGGAVGGSSAMRTHNSSDTLSSSSTAPTPISSASSTATSSSTSAPLPTILTGCPGINGTEYSDVPGPAGGTTPDRFIKMCGGTNARWIKTDHQLMSAFVPSLEACIQMCSNWNFWHASDGLPRCITAALIPDGSAPCNCWITNDTVQVADYYLAIGSLVQ